jgi:hypothetical protein
MGKYWLEIFKFAIMEAAKKSIMNRIMSDFEGDCKDNGKVR